MWIHWCRRDVRNNGVPVVLLLYGLNGLNGLNALGGKNSETLIAIVERGEMTIYSRARDLANREMTHQLHKCDQ